MWESMMGKSITSLASNHPPSRSALRSPRRGGDGKFSQSFAHALQHRRFGRLDLLEIGERFDKTRARHDHDAVAIADHQVAGGDRRAAADDRQADRTRATIT